MKKIEGGGGLTALVLALAIVGFAVTAQAHDDVDPSTTPLPPGAAKERGAYTLVTYTNQWAGYTNGYTFEECEREKERLVPPDAPADGLHAKCFWSPQK